MRLLHCLNPTTGWRKRGINPLTGRKFGLCKADDVRSGMPFLFEEVAFRCGKCINCLKYRASVLLARCVAESYMHDDSAFVTLTVDDDNLQSVFPGASLVHKPFQDFFKRLRKRVGPGVKYMMCGEYGEFSLRPHYHVLVFGVSPYHWNDTMRKLPNGLANRYDRVDNPVFSDSWPFGNVYCGNCTPASVAYVSGYTLKQFALRRDDTWYKSHRLSPEYVKWSRRPGLGSSYFDHYDCLVEHGTTVQAGVPVNNRLLFPGRYFLDRLRLTSVDNYDKLLASYARGNSCFGEGTSDELDQALAQRDRNVDYNFHSLASTRRM